MILLLLACGPGLNQVVLAPDAPFELDRVRTALWWVPDPSGASLFLSPLEFGCDELRADTTGELASAGPILNAYLVPAEEEAFVGEYEGAGYSWGELWDEPLDRGTFWTDLVMNGSGIDAMGGIGHAVVEELDDAQARGWIATGVFEVTFRADVCEAGRIEVACEPTEEVCNGVDDDCDGEVDEGLATTLYLDEDGDGHGAGEVSQTCDDTGEYATTNDDCNDADPAVFPGAAETCNGVDDDCDGEIDEGACG